jgi:hypothetical protein
MYVYIIYKQGIYGHGIFGVYNNKIEGIFNCKKAANNDKDDYHEYCLYKIEIGILFTGEDRNGFVDVCNETKKLVFKCCKTTD